MEAPPSGTPPIFFSVDAEDPYARVKRLGYALGLIAAVTTIGLSIAPVSGDTLVMVICIAVMFSLAAIAEVIKRRSLVLRSDDCYTVGAPFGSPVRWDALDSIEPAGVEVELVFHDGLRQYLPLKFLKPIERYEAIQRMIRIHRIFRHRGPLRFPAPTRLGDKDEKTSLRAWNRDDRKLSLELARESPDFQLDEGTTPEMAGVVFDESLAAFKPETIWRKFAIEAEGTSIGALLVHLNDPILRHVTFGIDLLPEHCGQGHGSAALRILLTHLRDETNLIKVSAGCFSDNPRCRRVLEKCGMRNVGTYSKFWFKPGGWKSGEVFELDLDEARCKSALAEAS